MLMFWTVAGVLTVAAAGLIMLRAARAAGAGVGDSSQQVYLRQLAELDELAGRGLIGEAEHKAASAEAGRRLLAASDAPVVAWDADARTGRLVLLGAVASAAIALGIYLVAGAPGFPDQPYARRLAGWKSQPLETLGAPQIAAVVRDLAAKRQNDPEALRMLALAEGASDNAPGAVRALRRATNLAPARADLWRTLGEALVYRDAGKIEAEAQRAFAEALRLDPADLAARFYLAQAKFDAGDNAAATAGFRAVLDGLPVGDERRPTVEAALARAEGRAPAAAFPPEQLAAIRGMVESLAAKLEQDPDNAEGWVRLIRSYSVLGETEKRDAAVKAARARYANAPNILKQIEDAARPATAP
jgi:cytochrome c-type biogenesis protein CcmH